MKIIDMLGKPCPVPVIEAKKALADDTVVSALVKVDNIVAVQNLEKMAKGYGYDFKYTELSKNHYEAAISKIGEEPASQDKVDEADGIIQDNSEQRKLAVIISKNAMGEGSEELGKILIKGFIYSLTELHIPPGAIIFFNSGVYLACDGSSTIDDLKKLEEKGTKILSCGTCLNYFGLREKLAVGEVADMYGITENMASAFNVINI